MFVGNIGGGGAAGGYPHCGTNANTNLIFPDPGASVDQFNTDELSIRVGPTGQCAGTGSTLSNYGSVGLQQTALRSIASASTFVAVTAKSAPNAATGVASTATTSASSYSTTTTVAEFVTISVAPATVTATDIISTTSTTTNSSSTTSMTSSTATASAPVNSASASASASLEGGQEDTPKPTPVSTGSGTAQTGACTTEGMWNCIGGSSFQQCASGSWSAPQPMAAGTACQAGQNLNLEIAAKPAKPRGDVQFIDVSPHESDDKPTSKPTTTPPPTPPPPPPPASTPPPPPPGSGSDLSGACPTEGMWNCIGGSSFQQCASGSWSASQQMAAGTTCQAGQSMDLGIVAKPKRAIRFSGEHVHMREAF
jgi:hypothetical protein